MGGGCSYVGDRVELGGHEAVVSRPVEDAVEDLLAADLALAGGVIALALQGGPEFDGGDEEVRQGTRSGSPSRPVVTATVAEHAPVQLDAQLAHFAAFVVAGKLVGLALEGFDPLGYGEILVGDGPVGDSRVNIHPAAAPSIADHTANNCTPRYARVEVGE
jgi:hypothetical protein